MKVLYVISGIGYGDSTREHANILALKKLFPNTRIMIAGYDNSYRYFKDKYPTVKIQGYKLPGKNMKINVLIFGLRNLLLPLHWLFSTLKVPLYTSKFIPDLIISDFEPAGISLAKLLQKKCIVVFGFDPLLYREYAQKHKVNYKMWIEAKYFEKLYHQADVVIIPTFKRNTSDYGQYKYVNPIVRQKRDELPSEL